MHARIPLVALVMLLGGCSSAPSGEPSADVARQNQSETTPAPEGIVGVIAVAATDPKTDRSHVAGKVAYATTPPTRGPHNAIWQNCGFYTKPVADENAVHALEHGAVWITYADTVDAATRARLATLAKASRYVLISPYAANPTPIVLSAWARQLRVPSIDDPRVTKFIETYAQNGPTVPEVGAPCSGGLGEPPDRPSTVAS